jgi:tight adherence protein C
MQSTVAAASAWPASLVIATAALVLAVMLLLRWVAGVASDVPQENRDYLDPPPSYWRWIGWLAHPIAAWTGPVLPVTLRRQLMLALRRAGLEYALTVDQFIAGQVVGGLAAAMVSLALAWPLELRSHAWLLAAAAVGGYLPLSWLRDRIASRSRRIAKTLPFYLDVITLAIEGGCNMTGALQHAADKGPQGPMSEELQRVLRDIRAGRTRADALRSLAERLRMPAISQWVAAVLAAERQGSSLAPILRAQAEQRRMERFLRAEALALKAPVKMLFPLMTCIFPCTFVIVFFPVVVQLVHEGILG